MAEDDQFKQALEKFQKTQAAYAEAIGEMGEAINELDIDRDSLNYAVGNAVMKHFMEKSADSFNNRDNPDYKETQKTEEEIAMGYYAEIKKIFAKRKEYSGISLVSMNKENDSAHL